MTQDNILKNHNADFEKVCKVSTIISQVCQIRGLDWLEKRLLNQWSETVLEYQAKDTEISFILAKWHFIDYMRGDSNVMNDDPITPFLIDVIKYV